MTTKRHLTCMSISFAMAGIAGLILAFKTDDPWWVLAVWFLGNVAGFAKARAYR